MNVYKKFCPNVFVVKTEKECQKGDVITVTTRHGKENAHIVHNLVGKRDGCFFYSITRADGFDSQERAKKKIEKLNGYANSAEARSESWREKSEEGKDFLVLAEPIKTGHHSEKRHRALIERNRNRFSKAMAEKAKAEEYRSKTAYWESKTKEVNLSMPESLEMFTHKLEIAKAYHKGLKDGSIEKEHAYSTSYARKAVKDLEKKVKLATTLWG